MKTVEIAYSELQLHSCPNCKAVYFSEVDCHCLNALDITDDVNVLEGES